MSNDTNRPLAPPIPTVYDEDNLVQAIAHALIFDGRRRTDQAAHLTATVAAARIVEKLKGSNWEFRRKPPTPSPTIDQHPIMNGGNR